MIHMKEFRRGIQKRLQPKAAMVMRMKSPCLAPRDDVEDHWERREAGRVYRRCKRRCVRAGTAATFGEAEQHIAPKHKSEQMRRGGEENKMGKPLRRWKKR
eukprot:6181835-Pleurochrysis_carterae.AAC.2